jgi:tRNA(fMet)-specific endonuclease VapC
MLYLLDTDHNTVLQRGSEGVTLLLSRLRNLNHDDFGTSIVSYEEQSKGWVGQINSVTTPESRVKAYIMLKANLYFYSNIAVWDYDANADTLFTQFVKEKVRVGTKDLYIASIALANNATLLTRNAKDFQRVPNLLFADWTI